MDSVQKFHADSRNRSNLREVVVWILMATRRAARNPWRLNLLSPAGTMPRSDPSGRWRGQRPPPDPPRAGVGGVLAGVPKGCPLTPPQFRTSIAAATDVGRRRTGNEDSWSLWTAERGGEHAADTLLLVCDGMGGTNA